jgi:hypothetical protein
MNKQQFLTACLAGFIWAISYVGTANAGSDDADQLKKERLEAAKKGFETTSTLHYMWIWSARVLECELALSDGADSRIAAYENQLRRTDTLEKMVVDGQKSQTYTVAELMEAKFYRLDAKCKLAEEKTKKVHASK